MSRDSSKTQPNTRKAVVDGVVSGDATLVSVSGLVDERFPGFGDVSGAKCVVINVSGMTRLSSFGVRQWLNAMDALPKTVADLYLLGCPTFFVDQLNMVLNFGGRAKILTVLAPYTCTSCGVESGEVIDVLVHRANLSKGGLPEIECGRCGGALEFDETPESYFAFVGKYAASNVHPAAAQLLAAHQLYKSTDSATEKPPQIIKLVHGSVTYFRISGTIGSMFRARPFLVGAEGETVIDLAEVERFDNASQKEWRRLLKSLSAQVPAVTLMDVGESALIVAGDSFTLARNIAVASVLVPYECVDCGRIARTSQTLLTNWPRELEDRICSICGGITRSKLAPEALAPLKKASTSAPAASAKLVAQRDEVLSRAITDASVARAGAGAVAALTADETILGKYKIVRRLSEGGMAEVFLAKQVGIGGFEKPVALKRIQRKLLDSRHLAIDMFLNEAKIAGRLTHPNIVQVLDVGEAQGALYLAMEFVHGKDVRDLLKKLQKQNETLPVAEACYIVRQVAQALHHAYFSTDLDKKQLSVVHRDVSPQNVILGYDGSVKLLDFGVAMSSVTEHEDKLVVGKWMYMAPEATSNKPTDHRSDLFSLGVVLYVLCSGAMPFFGKDPKEIVKKIHAGQYKPLLELVPVPERLSMLVSRMLAADPAERPESGEEIAAELTEIARAFDMDSSSANISKLLARLFPTDASGLRSEKTSSVFDIQSGSLSPLRNTTPATFAGAIDMSVSLKPAAVSAATRPTPTSISQVTSTSAEFGRPSSSITSVGAPSAEISIPQPIEKPKPKLPMVKTPSRLPLVIGIAIALGLAFALYYFLERPF